MSVCLCVVFCLVFALPCGGEPTDPYSCASKRALLLLLLYARAVAVVAAGNLGISRRLSVVCLVVSVLAVFFFNFVVMVLVSSPSERTQYGLSYAC